ncbi:hypothetical protein EW146_g1960 [Bondarzewia mesenterica]|uniref:BHLH domain-containing protein n=1 Tax=Bondarzewia mesenterica TaxID=1095465 RepID=A0A4S4M436_9AGAM|nr:hypothetical protein EW146_g1960 [Bondarzewia mesenterica]
MSSTQANHDPSLSHQPVPQSANSTNVVPQGAPVAQDITSLLGLGSDQVIALLRNLPDVFTKLAEQGNLKEAAAETLSNLSQATFPHAIPGQQPGVHTFQASGPNTTMHSLPSITDPGPSSHPRGPPNLGQLTALAAAAGAGPPMSATRQGMQEAEEDAEEERGEGLQQQSQPQSQPASNAPASSGRTRGGRGVNIGSDEWARQRKDNHKEVERRRRGNINEGINELGRIVPNGSGEKAKGAILSRAVQYIHHLKENEARNIEKWTLEKLLMDQAMGDLQQQLEEMRRMWEEERMARQRAESELDVLRGLQMRGAASAAGPAMSAASVEKGAETIEESTGEKRERAAEGEGKEKDLNDEARLGKRQRTD